MSKLPKAIIVPDFAYMGTRQRQQLRGKLKYFQFRDDRDGHIPRQRALERWVDRGLGRDYRDILKACSRLRSKHVLAWTWVISPTPDLMALVPENRRRELLMNLTEQVVEGYYLARNMDPPEYSYVCHDRLTTPDPDEPDKPPMQHLHTHMVLPGTVASVEGGRSPVYNNKNRRHDALFHTVATDTFARLLDAEIGPGWRRLRPGLDWPEVIETPQGGRSGPEWEQ